MIEYDKYTPLLKGPFKSVDDALKEADNALRFIRLFIPTAKLIVGGSLPFYIHYADKNTEIVMNDIDATLFCNVSSNKMAYAWASSRPAGTFKTVPRPDRPGKDCYIIPVGDIDLHIEYPDYRGDDMDDFLSCDDTSETNVYVFNKNKVYTFYNNLNREKDQIKLNIMRKKLGIS